jgi:hypothetical protein
METMAANGSGRDTVRSYDRGRGAVRRALLPDAAALPEATGPGIWILLCRLIDICLMLQYLNLLQ